MQNVAPLTPFLNTEPLNTGVMPIETPAPIAARILDASSLLAGARQVVIDHEGKLYRLSLTKNNRLILQK